MKKSKVLKLTGRNGKLCLVNLKKFEQAEQLVYNDEIYTKIHFNRGYCCVKETPEEVYDKLYPIVVE